MTGCQRAEKTLRLRTEEGSAITTVEERPRSAKGASTR
ncbi:hypothetical protein SAMN05443572_111146 [Myxococcus fulvus]|uniref:Lipoprotein n=1 Tax=Myxococcus fulvus TaxID=33 RepID=A0ABY1CT48_MYXFU|nr:hypothetical protein SAMN05443572_111146 [Myxococcus fulvus]